MGLRIAVVAGVVAVLAGTAAIAAPLVTNGSFEAVTVAKKSRFAGNVTGWTVGNPSSLTFIDFPGTADDGSYLSVYRGFPAVSPDGGNFVEADGDPTYASAISQTLTGLTAGASYAVDFYQAAGQQVDFTGPTTERWAVSLGGTTKLSSIFSLPQGATGPWQSQTLTFVADASSDVLSFLATGTPGGAPPISFLDGVDVRPVGAVTPVPAPGVLATVGAGLLALLVARRAFLRG